MATVRDVKARLIASDAGFGRTFQLAAGAVVGVTLALAALKKGLAVLTSEIGKSVEASAVQEAAEIKLAQAIRTVGGAVDEELPKLKARASALQDLTNVGDETILSQQALLRSLGGLSGEGLDRATRAALDLGTVTGNVEGAFDLVAKAASGYTSTLSRYGIIIEEGLSDSEKFAAALSKIEELFGGQAEAATKGFSSTVQGLNNDIGDLRETIGEPFRELLTVVFNDLLRPAIRNLNAAASSSLDFRDGLLGAAQGALAIAVSLGPVIDRLLLLAQVAANIGLIKLEGQFKALQIVAAGLGATMFQQLQGLKAVLSLLGEDVPESALSQQLKALLETVTALRKARQDGAGDDGNPFGPSEDDVDNASDYAESIAGLPEQVLAMDDAFLQVTENGTRLFVAEVGAGIKAVQSLRSTLRGALGQSALSAIDQVGSALIEAAAGGEVAFGKLFVQLLADLAAAIIKALALRAILAAVGAPIFFNQGGIVGANRGLIVSGGRPFTDSVAASLTPGEAVLPKDLTEFLLRAAAGDQPGGEMTIVLQSDVPQLVERVNEGVRQRRVRVIANELAAPRQER